MGRNCAVTGTEKNRGLHIRITPPVNTPHLTAANVGRLQFCKSCRATPHLDIAKDALVVAAQRHNTGIIGVQHTRSIQVADSSLRCSPPIKCTDKTTSCPVFADLSEGYM